MIFIKFGFSVLLVLFLITDVLFPVIRFFMRRNKPIAAVKGRNDNSSHTVDGEVIFK